jgi:hypothetical protein
LLIFGLIQSNLFGKHKTFFWIFCGYGMVCTLLAKLTVLYSVPPLEQNILSYLLLKLKDGFNDGNILTLLTNQKPINSFYFFIILLAAMFLMRPKSTIKTIEQS